MSDAMSDASHEALRDLHGAVRERIADAVLKQHPGGASVDTIVNATIDAIPTVLAEPAQPEGLTEKVAALPDASRLVRQRGDDDCEIAATAMVLRCSYEDAARRLEWDDDGHRSPIDVISEHGIAARLVCAAKQTGVVWPPEPMANLHYCRVLPRADAPHAHAVVMLADGSVLDPWTDEPKRLTDYPAVYEVWVLGEPKADEAEGRVTDPTSEPAQQVDTIPADFDANFIRDMADKYEHDSMNRRWPGSLPHRGFADIAKALRYALAVAQHGRGRRSVGPRSGGDSSDPRPRDVSEDDLRSAASVVDRCGRNEVGNAARRCRTAPGCARCLRSRRRDHRASHGENLMSKHDRYYRHPLTDPCVITAKCEDCDWEANVLSPERVRRGIPIDIPAHEQAKLHIDASDHRITETTIQTHRFNGQ